jgi:glyoxylase-like metal-dependent hydrolase (beta-lactamase superfamily II)
MGDLQRRVGDYEVVMLRDGVFEPPADMLAHAGGDAARQRVIDSLPSPTLEIPVNCFLLRGPGGVTLVDSGGGSGMGEAFGQARAQLKAAGIEPDQIDRVLLTHLHPDHLLGLLENGAPFLPRAHVLVPATDLAYFTDASIRSSLPENARGAFDLTQALMQAYGDRLHSIPEGQIAGPLAGIEAMPLPGHTPGHTGYLIRGGNDTLLIWADTIHVESLQPAEPQIGLIFDTDRAQAVQTRQSILERSAEANWVVTGSHVFGFYRVQSEGDAFALQPA